MTDTPFKHRDPATQERLNEYMRRRDVLEYLFFHSLNAEPATPAQVAEFLAVAPPEVFVALDGLLPVGHGPIDGSVHENPVVRGFVGMIRARGGK